jgi:hypothetical protein
MAKSSTTAGATVVPSAHLPEGWEDFPKSTQVAAELGLSRVRLAALCAKHAIKRVVGPKGSLGGFRIHPDDVARLDEILEGEEDEQDEKPLPPTTGDVVRASVDGLKQAQAHTERLVTLFDGPYKFVLDTMREENGALRAELATMRTERAEWQAQREQARQQESLEAMALVEIKSEAATKSAAIDLAKKIGTHMLQKHLGMADPKVAALQAALAAIPRESFEVLFKMGVLPPEAEAQLKIGLDWQDSPAPTETEAMS